MIRSILITAMTALGLNLTTASNVRAQDIEGAWDACESGILDACNYVVSHTRGKDIELYRKALNNGCMMGARMSCGEAHFTFKKDSSPLYDPVMAGKAAQVGCQNNLADMCMLAGKYFGETAKAPIQDLEVAEIAYSRACGMELEDKFFDDHDRETACTRAYNSLLETKGELSFEMQAVRMRGCEAGYGWMCGPLAVIFLNGPNGFPRVPEYAIKYSQMGCDLGEMDACATRASIAHLYEDDDALAISLAAPACMKGAKAYNCELAATLTYYVDPPEGYSKADILTKACDMDIEVGCDLLLDQANAQMNVPEMERLGRKACDLGSDYGCRVLQNIANARAKSQSDHRQLMAELDRQWKAEMASKNARIERRPTFSVPDNWFESRSGGTQATPFGNTARDIENWNKYQAAQCAGNPRC